MAQSHEVYQVWYHKTSQNLVQHVQEKIRCLHLTRTTKRAILLPYLCIRIYLLQCAPAQIQLAQNTAFKNASYIISLFCLHFLFRILWIYIFCQTVRLGSGLCLIDRLQPSSSGTETSFALNAYGELSSFVWHNSLVCACVYVELLSCSYVVWHRK